MVLPKQRTRKLIRSPKESISNKLDKNIKIRTRVIYVLKYTKTTLECNFERFSIFVFFVKEINSESIWTKSNLGFCQGTWVALRLYGTEAAEELFLPAPPFLGWRCRGKDRTWRPATLRKLAHQSSRRWFEHCLSTFGPIAILWTFQIWWKIFYLFLHILYFSFATF